MSLPAEQPTVRVCLGCWIRDDHPRHIVVVADPSAPGGTVDIAWHMDCHREITGCEVCTQQLSGAAGKKGNELRAHLVSLPSQEG